MINIRIRDNVINPGDTFVYPVTFPSIGAAGECVVKKNVMVVEVHTHHVLVVDMESPYLKYSLQNFDLMQHKIIQMSDCIMQEKPAKGGLKFKDRGV